MNPHPQFVVNPKGKKTAVLLPIDEYEELLEDLHDLAAIAERRNDRCERPARDDGIPQRGSGPAPDHRGRGDAGLMTAVVP